MSTGMLQYKGYLGSINASPEDGCLWGKLEHIGATITYEAETVNDLEAAFHEAVNDYLKTCEQQGYKPEKPCKGSFNVRTKSDTHRDLVLLASQTRKSLNEIANEAFTTYLNTYGKCKKSDLKVAVKDRTLEQRRAAHKSSSSRKGGRAARTV